MASQEDEEKQGCERLGKLLFLKLDPPLRNLLVVLQQYQEIVEKSSQHEIREKDPNDDDCVIIGGFVPGQLEPEERILGLHRAEVDLLKQVKQILQTFPEDPLVVEAIRSSSVSAQQLSSGSISILMDYISLPLVSIFRRPQSESVATFQQATGNLETARRKLHIRQGAERKSVAEAAQTLKVSLYLIHQGSSSTEALISQQKLIQLVLACSSALPTGREIAEQSTSSFETIGLDRGEAYIQSLLESISHLFLLSKGKGSFGNELANAMEGALLAHLADLCVSVVAPPSVSSQTTSLTALETFHNLLEVVPNPSVWRALFPGCFAGFFRTIVAGLRGTGTTHTIVIQASLKSLNGLLRLTLRGVSERDEEGLTKRTIADLQRIARSEGGSGANKMGGADARKILGNSSAPNRGQQPAAAAVRSGELDQNERFLREINERLPGPISVLIQLLRAAPSQLIRLEAVKLCELILIQTRGCWEKEVLQDLIIVSLESCLIISRDSDEAVVALAKSVLEEYRRTASSQNDMNRILSPRLVAMLEELPALAQRHCEVELTNQLKMISAFLALNNSIGGKRKTCKTLQSTLAAEGVFFDLRRAIGKMFDVDLRFPPPKHSSSIEVLDQGSLLLDSKPFTNGNKAFRYMFLSDAAEKEAHALIHELGRSLGPKHTSIVVDGVVADLFNDCIGRVEKGNSRTGRSQEAWCHEWIGCLTLVRELLNGAFTFVDDQDQTRVIKKVKHLVALATSIFPILSSSPLWDLPLNVTHLLGPERDQEIEWSNSRALISSQDTFSPMAVRGNACFMCGLFGIIDAICGLLRGDARGLLPTILPPLLQKATTTKVVCVREGAREALESISTHCGFDTLGNMIAENMNVVASSMLAALRLPGGRSSFPVESVPNEMFEVANTLRSVLELALHRGTTHQHHSEELDAKGLPVGSDKSSLTYVIELVTTLTERYDCFASKSRCDADTTLAMVKVYELAFSYLLFAYKGEEYEVKKQSCERKPSSGAKPWLEHLESFRKLEANFVTASIEDLPAASGREGFEAYHEKRQDEGSSDTAQDEQYTRPVSNQEIVFVSMLLSRCTFFLSNSSLRLQLESCNAMACGFQFLSVVASICKDPEDSARTAIRRQVNDSWPPIEARLVALTNEIQVSRRTTSIVVARRQVAGVPAAMKEMDVSTKRVFLSKLFDVVAIMAKCSEGFIASRFKNDVFPLLSKLLADFVGDLSTSEDSMNSNNCLSIGRTSTFGQPSKRSPRQASEISLIVSILFCLAGVFDQPKCGIALRDMVPAAGNLILPFLRDEDGRTSSACMTAIQQMVQIDCDALWRPLVLLSGRTFPPIRPWTSARESVANGDDEDQSGSTSMSMLAQRASSLFAFIDNLPEQALV